MKKYIKIYLDFFGYGEQDFVPCEICGNRSGPPHHIIFRSQGGKDEIENLIGLCQKHHEDAHKHILSREYLKHIHAAKIQSRKITTI